jgi:hypothetical protein
MTEAEERQANRAIHRLLRSFTSSDGYGLVLVMVIATYALTVSVPVSWGATLVTLVQIATVWQILRTSRARRSLRRVADALFVVAGIGAVAHFFDDTNDRFLWFLLAAGTVLYFIAPVSIVRHVAFRRDVDQETMLGALSAYLCFGMACAFAYRFLAEVQDTPFFGPNGDGDAADHLFFSFVTLTTTGYGNLVPAGNPGQSIAVAEALFGQLFLVTAVAKVVNAWTPKRWKQPDGPV